MAEYVVRRNGTEIRRANNIITTAGKQIILRYLAEYIGSMSGSIAVGAGTSAPAVTDTDMEYEFDRAEVLVRSADYDNDKITFIATLPRQTEGIISELGLWSATQNPDAGQYQSEMIILGDSDAEDWNGTFTWDQTNFRVGSQALALTSGDTVIMDGIDVDLSGYSDLDELSLLYFGGAATSLTITLSDGVGSSAYAVPLSTTGMNIARFAKASFSAGVDWSAISSISLAANGTVTVDSMRINDRDSFAPDYGLVSHALITPFTKDTTSEYEISYTIGFGIA